MGIGEFSGVVDKQALRMPNALQDQLIPERPAHLHVAVTASGLETFPLRKRPIFG
jgi:hypothetical protein